MELKTERRGGGQPPLRCLREHRKGCKDRWPAAADIAAPGRSLATAPKCFGCARMLLFFLDRLVGRAGPPVATGMRPRQDHAPRLAGGAGRALLLAVVCGPRSIAWLKHALSRADQDRARPTWRALHQRKAVDAHDGRHLHRRRAAGQHARALATGRTPICRSAVLLVLALAALGACDDLVKLVTSAQRPGRRARSCSRKSAIALAAAWLSIACIAQLDGGLELAVPLIDTAVRPGLAVRAAGDARDRGLVERGQPGRRSGWPGRRLPGVRHRRAWRWWSMPAATPSGPTTWAFRTSPAPAKCSSSPRR